MELISRVVGGWNVRITLRGKRIGKFFADTTCGGKLAALKAAKKYRDPLLAQKNAIPRRPPKPLIVSRGSTKSFQIRLPKRGGGTTTTEYSITLHGAKKAKQLALQALAAARGG